MGGKCCSACGEWQPYSEYYPESRTFDGRRAQCKRCVRERRRERYRRQRGGYGGRAGVSPPAGAGYPRRAPHPHAGTRRSFPDVGALPLAPARPRLAPGPPPARPDPTDLLAPARRRFPREGPIPCSHQATADVLDKALSVSREARGRLIPPHALEPFAGLAEGIALLYRDDRRGEDEPTIRRQARPLLLQLEELARLVSRLPKEEA